MISRRNFLLKIGSAAGLGLMAACAPAAPPTAQPTTGVAPTTTAGATLPPATANPVPSQPASAPPTAAATISSASAAPPTAAKITVMNPALVVAKGGDPTALVKAAVNGLGGITRFVKPGDRVVIKPNIGFAKSVEYAVATNPEVIVALIRLCQEAGAKTVQVFDNPVVQASTAYRESGIEAAASAAGAEVFQVTRLKFIETAIPKGKVIQKWPIYEDALTADVFINVPIVKNHGVSTLTLGAKNLMGVLGGNRGNLHQNIGQTMADIGTVVPVHLTIIDAVRVLMRNGPTGGNLRDVEKRDVIVAATDRVAADAYACSLANRQPSDVPYIKASFEAGLGEMDLNKVAIQEVSL